MVICPQHSSAQSRYSDIFNAKQKRAYRKALDLRAQSSKTLLLQPNTTDSNSTTDEASLYILQLNESLELIIGEDESKYPMYKERWEKRLSALQSSNKKSPYRLFFLAELRLQWAFVDVKFGHELSAALHLRRAFRLIKKNKSLHPDFLPNLKTMGLLHIMFGAIPDKYQWVLSFLGLEGDIDQGLTELSRLRTHSIFGTEAQLLLSCVQAYLLHEEKVALSTVKSLHNDNTSSLSIAYIYISILMKNAQGEEALSILSSLEGPANSHSIFHLLNYLRGENSLQKGDYKTAISSYRDFLFHFKGRNLVKDAHYKLFLAHWLNGDSINAAVYRKKALSTGTTYAEADKHAAKALENAHRINRPIMKIRLATDGGYYTVAKKLIKTHESFSWQHRKDAIEFIYRKARFYHKTGEEKLAIENYLSVISTSQGQQWYFAPNSALQLGYLYQKGKSYDHARQYFEKALSYKDYVYESSISNKAKSALKNMP